MIFLFVDKSKLEWNHEKAVRVQLFKTNDVVS